MKVRTLSQIFPIADVLTIVIGFVMIQLFGLNLRVGQQLKQTFPLIDAKSGSIELILEAKFPSSQPSINWQPISELCKDSFLTVGPIIGLVTSTSARILVECSKPMNLNVEVYPLAERSHFHQDRKLLKKKSRNEPLKLSGHSFLSIIPDKSTVKKQIVKIGQSNVPHVFELTNLQPDFV